MLHEGERISCGPAGAGHLSEDELQQLQEAHAQAVLESQAAEGGALSHFEVMTALALKHFQQQQVSIPSPEDLLQVLRSQVPSSSLGLNIPAVPCS